MIDTRVSNRSKQFLICSQARCCNPVATIIGKADKLLGAEEIAKEHGGTINIDFLERILRFLSSKRRIFSETKAEGDAYVILKHVIWRFQIYNLFREIFKFRGNKNNNVFREILKCFRETEKFEFFAKQIIYLESSDHPLQNDV